MVNLEAVNILLIACSIYELILHIGVLAPNLSIQVSQRGAVTLLFLCIMSFSVLNNEIKCSVKIESVGKC